MWVLLMSKNRGAQAETIPSNTFLVVSFSKPSPVKHVFATRCEPAVPTIEVYSGQQLTLSREQVTVSGIPAGKPPPGISPNFVNPQTLAPAMLAVSIVMMTWALLFVIFRLYANFHGPRGLGIDDCKTCVFLRGQPMISSS